LARSNVEGLDIDVLLDVGKDDAVRLEGLV
jgi:hypothetical protein